MEKKDFKENTRYTATVNDENGKARPSKFYVMKLHNDAMIVRITEKDGALIKVAYQDVLKIVDEQPVPTQNRYYIPEALLAETHWKGRSSMPHYSSMPHAGK